MGHRRRIGSPGVHRADRDGVDPDAVPPVVDGERPRQALDGPPSPWRTAVIQERAGSPGATTRSRSHRLPRGRGKCRTAVAHRPERDQDSDRSAPAPVLLRSCRSAHPGRPRRCSPNHPAARPTSRPAPRPPRRPRPRPPQRPAPPPSVHPSAPGVPLDHHHESIHAQPLNHGPPNPAPTTGHHKVHPPTLKGSDPLDKGV